MSLSEFETISRYFRRPKLGFQREGVVLGIGDDGAVVQPPAGASISMSMDLLVEGIHFPSKANGYGVGSRSLAVNLSDLAAMAAQPLCFTLGLTLNRLEDSWLQEFSSGLAEMAEKFNCPLVGGDLTRGPMGSPAVIAIQVHGIHPDSDPVLRSMAKVGDGIFTTGTLGNGAAALHAMGLDSHLGELDQSVKARLSKAHSDFLNNAYFKPQPRIDFAVAASHYMTACIDVSDGLIGDLGHILGASKVGAAVMIDKIPYSDAVLNLYDEQTRQQAALFGGDDYELCFTADKKNEAALLALAAQQSLSIQKIGEITGTQELRLLDSTGDIVQIEGKPYQHFV